jgi:hypothetical protein
VQSPDAESNAVSDDTADGAATVSTTTAAPVVEEKQTRPDSVQGLPITPIPGDDLGRQLIDVELRLSRTVAEPPATWQIEPLRREVEQLIAQATTETDRIAMKSTLAKLDRFAAIAQRYNQSSRSLATQPSAVIPPYPDAQSLTADSSRYDAIGILRPVVSKRPGAPQFALVDDRGQVVSFVTPSPDVNLQPYLGRRIGVTGNRGFIPEFQRSHVTAGRVSPLGGRMVR